MSEKRFKVNYEKFIENEYLPCGLIDMGENSHIYKIEDVCDLLNEQQDNIFKLQDLCGESDSENAKLRIENKRLQEEIERLQKIIDLTQYQLKVQDKIISKYEKGE